MRSPFIVYEAESRLPEITLLVVQLTPEARQFLIQHLVKVPQSPFIVQDEIPITIRARIVWRFTEHPMAPLPGLFDEWHFSLDQSDTLLVWERFREYSRLFICREWIMRERYEWQARLDKSNLPLTRRVYERRD